MPAITVDKVCTMQGHTGAIYALAAATADTFYSAGGDGMVVEWDVTEPDKGRLVAKVDSNIFSMVLLAEQNAMLLGQMQGGIHVLDLASKTETRHLALHSNGVFDLQIIEDTFLAAGGDGYLSQSTLENQNLLRRIPISVSSLRCIATHPTLPIIAIGTSDSNVYILDRSTLVVIQKLEGHSWSVFSAAFSPDGQWLLTGSRDAQLIVWKVAEKCEFYTRIPAHLFTINSIVYSPDGQLFATASRDKTIKIWDATSFKLLKVIDKEKLGGHANSVNKLLWPNHLISCSDDRSIIVWKITPSETD